MVQQEISLPPIPSPDRVIAAVNGCLAKSELTVSLRDTLRTFPGSTHWHAKRAGQRGVLEITFWPAESRLWLSVHRHRAAPWIETCLPALRTCIETAVAA